MPASNQPVNVDVTWEDQKKICLFGRLNQRVQDLKRQIEAKKELVEALGDAADELYIADDAKFVIGESFCSLSSASTDAMLEESKAKTTDSLASHQAELSTIESRMGLLKAELKAKFKDSIHLENE